MTKICFIGLLSLGLLSCSDKWEYKMVAVNGNEQEATKFESNKFDVTDESLNLFGKDGLELVGVFEKTETVHPNFGNDQICSGLQP
ncbi:MAG: hypothetical protein WDO19_17240 [Bacteroidota bacterium]